MKKMKWIAYCRVSSTNQESKGVSLQAQQHEIEQYAHEVSVRKVATIQEISSAFQSDPPLLKHWIQTAKQHLQPQRIVCVSIDRWSRSVDRGLQLAKIWLSIKHKSKQKQLNSRHSIFFLQEKLVLDQWPLSTEQDQAFRLGLYVAEQESKLISTRVKRSRDYLSDAGYHIGPVPFGQRAIQVNVNSKARLKLEVCPEEERILAFIQELKRIGTRVKRLQRLLVGITREATKHPLIIEYDGRSIHALQEAFTNNAIADLLNDYHIPYRNNALWTAQIVKRVVSHQSLAQQRAIQRLSRRLTSLSL